MYVAACVIYVRGPSIPGLNHFEPMKHQQWLFDDGQPPKVKGYVWRENMRNPVLEEAVRGVQNLYFPVGFRKCPTDSDGNVLVLRRVIHHYCAVEVCLLSCLIHAGLFLFLCSLSRVRVQVIIINVYL